MRVVLQGPFLLARREIPVLAEPVPDMALRMPGRSLVSRARVLSRVRGSLRSGRRGVVGVFLRKR